MNEHNEPIDRFFGQLEGKNMNTGITKAPDFHAQKALDKLISGTTLVEFLKERREYHQAEIIEIDQFAEDRGIKLEVGL